ncbi:GNAT family N-acetyltransferase [Vibrio sp. SCSIO 43133]|uniref:GNAT family N-acetyltransferase n=1 Tax=Vibrio sp. SCSIO 43133 TaxID=2802577 RepID=UPI002075CB1F|nr:GNAT family N-acetyltransferase [Vibrio sp. SCSIO 43133]USE03376.1 GNAT family N-acetyltransferase [Vibrio sp. SCSIO 43133]
MQLEKITNNNLNAVLALQLDEAQRDFVSENVVSMAQAAVNPDYQPRVAMVDGEVIGFVMYSEWKNAPWATSDKLGEYYIFRVMTDKSYQGKGYGRLMMEALIKEIEELKPKAIHIGYCDENKVAQQFYQKLGFKEYGRFDWGDIAASIVY